MKRYGTKAQKKIEKVMKEYEEGKLKSGKGSKKVQTREQAIAIGISEARRRGYKVPKQPLTSKKKSKSSVKKVVKKSAKHATKKSVSRR